MVKVAGAARGVWRLMLLALIAALCVITGPVAAAGAVSAVPAGAAPATTTSAGFTYDPSTPWAGVEQRAADGDIGSASGSTDAPRPETDAGVAADAGAGGFGALSKAGDFGVWPYRTFRADLSGTGLEAHHLIEQRFAGAMGQSASDMASVAVTKADHQAFTNAWRQAIPSGEGTANATPAQIHSAARQIYADYPDILSALGLG